MGGLWRKMPWTTATWVIGALSLAGIPPLAGFWSKDEILLAALHSGQHRLPRRRARDRRAHRVLHGRAPRSSRSSRSRAPTSKSEHAHESPWVMTGAARHPRRRSRSPPASSARRSTDYAFGKFLGEHAAGEMNFMLAAIAVGAALAAHRATRGRCTSARLGQAGLVPAATAFVAIVLARQFWIDEAYAARHRRRRRWRSPAFFRRIDAAVVDGVVRGVRHGRARRQPRARGVRPQGRRRRGRRARRRRRRAGGRESGAIADRQRADLPAAARRLHRRARAGVRTMSGLPVLSIIVLAPVAGALLIALFGAQPQGAARHRAGRRHRQPRRRRSWVYADLRPHGRPASSSSSRSRGSRRSASRTRSASTASRCRCCC